MASDDKEKAYHNAYRKWERKHYTALKEIFDDHLDVIAASMTQAERDHVDAIESQKPKRGNF
jgi:hypothetical protein